MNNVNEFVATGRRKCAVARVRVTPGTGEIIVNGKPCKEYFCTDALCGYINQPLKLTGNDCKVDIKATICGGGLAGQSGALRHGITRALMLMDEALRSSLKAAGMVTRDARVKERKNSGQPGARKRFQFSKR